MTNLGHIKAVALDFDGTLIEPGNLIADEAREAISRAVEAGLLVCTASGRPPGNQVEILTANGLGPETRLIAALCCDERSVWILDGERYAPHLPWNADMEAAWERLMPQAVALCDAAVSALQELGLQAERRIAAEEIRERGLVDLRLPCEADATRAHAWLTEQVAAATPELHVTCNWHLVQILAACGGKGNSVAAMARALGLEPREMLAVGDRNNDTSMLDGSAGLTPAAVGNAIDEIKALVRSQGGYLATAPVGAGVAEILDAVVASRNGSDGG